MRMGPEEKKWIRIVYITEHLIVKSFMCNRFVMYTIKKGTWEAVFDQTGFYPEGGGQPMIQEQSTGFLY